MLVSIDQLRDYTLQGEDVSLGKVFDLYFDERSWKVQFLVADTRKWLVGRLVLVSPEALGKLDREQALLTTSLTQERLQSCPSIEEHRPVSRQHARDAAKYWDWPYFLPGDPRFDLGAFADADADDDDPHLRSAQATTGYRVRASDGNHGHIGDWLLDPDTWTLREAVIDTGNWLPGEKLRLPCSQIRALRSQKEHVEVDLTESELTRLSRYTGPAEGA